MKTKKLSKKDKRFTKQNIPFDFFSPVILGDGQLLFFEQFFLSKEGARKWFNKNKKETASWKNFQLLWFKKHTFLMSAA